VVCMYMHYICIHVYPYVALFCFYFVTIFSKFYAYFTDFLAFYFMLGVCILLKFFSSFSDVFLLFFEYYFVEFLSRVPCL